MSKNRMWFSDSSMSTKAERTLSLRSWMRAERAGSWCCSDGMASGWSSMNLVMPTNTDARTVTLVVSNAMSCTSWFSSDAITGLGITS